MISLDISILYQVILFVLLWLILTKVLFRPYLHLLEDRERKTTGAQHDSSDLEHEGARLRTEYDEKIKAAQSAAYGEKERLVQAARIEREKVLSQARDEATQFLDRARQEIAQALAAERGLAAAEATSIATAIASKVLGRNVA